jgi:hypothetical protein
MPVHDDTFDSLFNLGLPTREAETTPRNFFQESPDESPKISGVNTYPGPKRSNNAALDSLKDQLSNLKKSSGDNAALEMSKTRKASSGDNAALDSLKDQLSNLKKSSGDTAATEMSKTRKPSADNAALNSLKSTLKPSEAPRSDNAALNSLKEHLSSLQKSSAETPMIITEPTPTKPSYSPFEMLKTVFAGTFLPSPESADEIPLSARSSVSTVKSSSYRVPVDCAQTSAPTPSPVESERFFQGYIPPRPDAPETPLLIDTHLSFSGVDPNLANLISPSIAKSLSAPTRSSSRINPVDVARMLDDGDKPNSPTVPVRVQSMVMPARAPEIEYLDYGYDSSDDDDRTTALSEYASPHIDDYEEFYNDLADGNGSESEEEYTVFVDDSLMAMFEEIDDLEILSKSTPVEMELDDVRLMNDHKSIGVYSDSKVLAELIEGLTDDADYYSEVNIKRASAVYGTDRKSMLLNEDRLSTGEESMDTELLIQVEKLHRMSMSRFIV